MLKTANGLPPIHGVKRVTGVRAFQNNSSAFVFYQNRQLELYASKEAKRLTLRQLVS